jgi:hypothetical protein
MSRARRGNAGYLSELIERENAVFGGDLSGQGLSAALGSLHGIAPPFPFSSQNAMLQEGHWDEAGQYTNNGNGAERSESSNSASGQQLASSSIANSAEVDSASKSYLYSVLRCGRDITEDRSTGTSQVLFAKHVVASGILTDSVTWVKASVDAQAKKIQLSSIQKSMSILRDIVDEEGNPLLQLAISFGCSTEVIGYLISRGAVVGSAEIKKAATTDQPSTLSILLQHTSYLVDSSSSEFSEGVLKAFAEAKSRQEDLDRKMREKAGVFMVQLLQRLLLLGLSARRQHSPHAELCSRAIAEILVGNVLLRNLQQAQRKAEGPEGATSRMEEDESCNSEDGFSPQGSVSIGLMTALPVHIIEETVISSAEKTTAFLSLVEDYLCSKDMSDGAAGLTILLTLLTKVPSLTSCKEMERFGMASLVSFHDALATTRMGEILSNEKDQEEDSPLSESKKSSSPRSIVVCPKKHTALIHITRHSSFRCDICGTGVERGRPMHGCRECDWDACENCTDKAESGLVKCSAIKDIASNCIDLLSQDSHPESETSLSKKRSMTELQVISARLLQRDVLAMKDLCKMLKAPGSITVHEFLSIVLPTLHASFVGRTASDGEPLRSNGHRSKKARVGVDADENPIDALEERIMFCKEAVRLLASQNDKTEAGDSLAQGQMSTSSSSSTLEESGDRESKPLDETDGNGDQFEFSAEAQELLRRLHQILSLREGVTLRFMLADDVAASNEVKGSDLQALTKSIEVKLSPSSFSSEAEESTSALVVNAEPLVPVKDLTQHILRSFKVSDPSYVEFSKR